MNEFWTVIISVLSSSGICGLLIWRIKKSIQHEYDVKLEGFKAGYQKVLDENRIAFSWWYDEQAKAIKEIYSSIAKLCISIDAKLRCLSRGNHQCNCDSAVMNTYKDAKKIWECNKIFVAESLHPQLDEIFSISFDIKTSSQKANSSCDPIRKNAIEYCQQNKEKINTILSELRKELRTVMSGGSTNE